MKYLSFPFLLLLLPLIGFGCSSDEEETDSLILSSDSETYFEQGIDFPATSGTRTLSFSAGRSWRISLTGADTRTAADWCTVTPSSGGAGDASVTVSTQENTGYDSRSVKLTLVTGGIEKSFTVSQKQKDALTLTASRFEIGKEGGNVQVEVKANIAFEVEIPEADRSWISQVNTRGLVSANLTFAVAPNQGPAGREGEIVIRSGSLSEKLRITQEGNCDDGLSFRPGAPDADLSLTLYFKATKDSPLYDYTGDVYVHAGVVSEGSWMHVPADGIPMWTSAKWTGWQIISGALRWSLRYANGSVRARLRSGSWASSSALPTPAKRDWTGTRLSLLPIVCTNLLSRRLSNMPPCPAVCRKASIRWTRRLSHWCCMIKTKREDIRTLHMSWATLMTVS